MLKTSKYTDEKTYKIGQMAKLAGISIRTLQFYDKTGLLIPDKLDSGYRIYRPKHIAKLQQILFYREIGFSLDSIKAIISNPGFNRIKALKEHRIRLTDRRKRINQLIETIDNTLKEERGEKIMSDSEKFKGFNFAEGNQYEDEARTLWGDKVVDESKQKVAGFGAKEVDEMNTIYHNLVALMDNSPSSPEVQNEIGKWYTFLNKISKYTPEMFEGLGNMYVADSRFTDSIDRFGKGLSVFMRDGMKVYASSNKK